MNRRAILAAGAAAFVTRPRRAGAAVPLVRIGTTPIDAGAQPYYAQAMGFFAKAGIAVEITAISNGSALAAAVAAGSLDIGQSNVVSLASAHERGIPFALVAPASTYTWRAPQSALAVPATSTIRQAKDLNGKTIAVSGLKTISQLGPQAWIDKNGGDLPTVKFVEMTFSEMPDALAKNRVDAALISEPVLSDAVAGGARVIANCYDAIARDFLIGAWFTTGPWAAANPQLVRTYVGVMRQTARWANAHHAESGRILADETHIPVSPATKRVIYGETLDAGAIQPLLDACTTYGLLKNRVAAADLIARS